MIHVLHILYITFFLQEQTALSRPRLALQDSTLRQATVTTTDYTETIGETDPKRPGRFPLKYEVLCLMEVSQVMGIPQNNDSKLHKFSLESHGDLGIPMI